MKFRFNVGDEVFDGYNKTTVIWSEKQGQYCLLHKSGWIQKVIDWDSKVKCS